MVSTYARADEGERKGLCSGTETTYFMCQTGKQKLIALCGTVPEALQYRFGRENHAEFQFPEITLDGAEKFLFAHYMRHLTDRTEVGFNNKGVNYAIFSYSEMKSIVPECVLQPLKGRNSISFVWGYHRPFF